MKTILPPHLKVGQTVEDLASIIPEAIEICKGIQNGDFVTPGSPHTGCYAMAQPQVSSKPLRYFVMNPLADKSIVKQFEGLLIINPRILSKDKDTRIMHPEGCMSYPFRGVRKVKRFKNIVVTYTVVKDLNHPEYVTLDNKELTGMASMIFQHELEHLNGKSIWTN